MRLSAKSEYALLALVDLAQRGPGALVSVREIAERQDIPARFLEQVFAALRRAGVVKAVRGAKGGYGLGRPAERLTVLEVVEAVEGPLQPTVCDTARGGVCPRGSACAAGAVWERAGDALRGVFAASTLADVAGAQDALDAGKVGP